MNLMIAIPILCFISAVAGIPASGFSDVKDFNGVDEMNEANRQADERPSENWRMNDGLFFLESNSTLKSRLSRDVADSKAQLQADDKAEVDDKGQKIAKLLQISRNTRQSCDETVKLCCYHDTGKCCWNQGNKGRECVDRAGYKIAKSLQISRETRQSCDETREICCDYDEGCCRNWGNEGRKCEPWPRKINVDSDKPDPEKCDEKRDHCCYADLDYLCCSYRWMVSMRLEEKLRRRDCARPMGYGLD